MRHTVPLIAAASLLAGAHLDLPLPLGKHERRRTRGPRGRVVVVPARSARTVRLLMRLSHHAPDTCQGTTFRLRFRARATRARTTWAAHR